MGNTRRLSRADWTGAALEAIARGGQAAVAIGPIADRLGAYASYLGHAQLVRATPHLVPEPGALAGYVERWVALLTSPTEQSGEAF